MFTLLGIPISNVSFASVYYYTCTPILVYTFHIHILYIYTGTTMGTLLWLLYIYIYIYGSDRYALFCDATRNYLAFRAPVYAHAFL